jgi:hypothetical protein
MYARSNDAIGFRELGERFDIRSSRCTLLLHLAQMYTRFFVTAVRRPAFGGRLGCKPLPRVVFFFRLNNYGFFPNLTTFEKLTNSYAR